jgi:pyruvate/2-oxoglutarate dehydrogenase complex dihydrolipoamide acyltransferase (E2) component
VGSISEKLVLVNDKIETREILHLTASFDHEIVDGAPAARLMKDLSAKVESGKILDLEIKNR